MTPKSLLRLRQAGAAPVELAGGGFAQVLADSGSDAAKVDRVVLCSGKVFYDLASARDDQRVEGVALLRIELLYPWPGAELGRELARYPRVRDVVWCQEEPANMGAWVHARLSCDRITEYAGRPASASPATGSLQAHKREQEALVRRALGTNRD
jgi:2-oxoglutarate dehydrogenase E1 component